MFSLGTNSIRVRRYDNHRAQRSLAKVLCPVVIGVVYIAAFLAYKLSASFPVCLGRMATDGALSGRVVGWNEFQGHARQLGFVGQLSLQIVERPRMQVSPMLFTSLYPSAYSLEVFKGYAASGAFGIGNNFFADTMIDIVGESGFLSTAFLKKSLSRFGSFVLESLTNTEITAANAFDLSSAKEFSITCGGQYNKTEINANVIGDWRNLCFWHGNTYKQIKPAISQDKIGFPTLEFQQVLLPLATDKWNLLSTGDSPDRNGIFIGLPRQNPQIITDASQWAEAALNIMVKLVSLGNLGDTTDYHLRRELRKVFSSGMVNSLMQIVLAEYLAGEGKFRNLVANAVGIKDRVPQCGILVGCGSQLNLANQFHGNTIFSSLENVNTEKKGSALFLPMEDVHVESYQ